MRGTHRGRTANLTLYGYTSSEQSLNIEHCETTSTVPSSRGTRDRGLSRKTVAVKQLRWTGSLA